MILDLSDPSSLQSLTRAQPGYQTFVEVCCPPSPPESVTGIMERLHYVIKISNKTRST